MSIFPISFRNRIALHYSVSTAVLVAIIFFITFFVVKSEVIGNLDSDLTKEISDLYTEITITDKTFWVETEEWREKEHNTLDINPIFIQFVDKEGRFLDRSPNLKKSNLSFQKASAKPLFYDGILDNIPVRQMQAPVTSGDTIVGYILVAVPLESALDVIESLQRILLVAYPLIFLVLFLIARALAGRSIRPVVNVIASAQGISHQNLSARIPYPKNRDLLYTLALTINNLLNRIEDAVDREKQFTSDASHELRTPISVIRGTLEVLIRKPRTSKEYVQNIQYTINEMERVSIIVDELLLLARFESQKEALRIEAVNINTILINIISRNSIAIESKKIKLNNTVSNNLFVDSDTYLLTIVLENLISNALKYSRSEGVIVITGTGQKGNVVLEIEDFGVGIPPEDLDKIFNSFYRSQPHDKVATGSGLGLSIVKRICELLQVNIVIESKLGAGTKVKLTFTDSKI